MKYAESEPDLEGIRYAASREQLRQQRQECQMQLEQLYAVLPITQWTSLVNDMHDHVAARAAVISEYELDAVGYGPPPVPYAFVAFGSSGRRESTLWSDQDHGLIISDVDHEEKEKYFHAYGRHLSNLLEYLGYEKCKGKVMCSEPLWRKTLEEWKRQIISWHQDFSWEPVRSLMIASDMRFIAGERSLAAAWKQFFEHSMNESPEMVTAILRNTVRHKATMNILGQVVTERFGEHAGDFDVKYGVYIPLVNSIRYMALQEGIGETSTLKRLERLTLLDGGNMLLENCQRAFLTALTLRAAASFTVNNGIYSSSGFLPQSELKKKPLLYKLRDSLTTVKRTHRALQRRLWFAERRRL
ncbi:DUF294 nucleotidyltransferase-like domain-containing protein [Paenibacillus sp. KQZ6P-2]|uniref:DUF294 nucleotidyltransferase-like domain-containing protein n=1 Tax=Paenibacillus mangrovi TaxID=2931978 RepID=A0A9X1WMJ8_9BACL|nr:DUF294 nucleotidyltransferase-like domain-containing protein [Paenibacillus mangrovi]MCJ8010378.1 DUF294 nucleotidyltransferase-like domain-containing protein [Paenibacillus mangrovi]